MGPDRKGCRADEADCRVKNETGALCKGACPGRPIRDPGAGKRKQFMNRMFRLAWWTGACALGTYILVANLG